jgi:hypothetical protein
LTFKNTLLYNLGNTKKGEKEMCHFVSWVEKRGKVYFLTMDKLTNTIKGQELLKTISMDDLCGHGTIRAYYRIDTGDGTDKECSDFSTLANFPSVIVDAIKSGKIRGIGIGKGLLRDAVDAKWDAERDAVDAKWNAERAAVNAKWNAESDAVNAKWKLERAAVDAKWKLERAAVDAKWKPESAAVDAKWNAESDAVYASFWDLFAIPENRNPVWR